MYNDASRNPVSALQCVDAILGPLQRGLEAGAFQPTPRHHYGASVRLENYEHLQARYRELAKTAELRIRRLRLESAKQALEIARLRAELAGRN